ncbi:MAG: hypothetical protein HY900_12855 [Deltaproteobacteria bacterium]|nr:hypothetical protein [Deltaproteobacteria bacterium]
MVRIVDVSPGHSLFQLISSVWNATTNTNNRAMHRLCTLMRKMGVQSAIVETLPFETPELVGEKEALDTYFGESLTAEVFRLSFSRIPVINPDDILRLPSEGAILSSSIVFNLRPSGRDWFSYVFSSIVGRPRLQVPGTEAYPLLLNNYIHSSQTFRCQIALSPTERAEFNIVGTFFCQQNLFTSRCAHAALSTALNNTVAGAHQLVYPHHLNKVLGLASGSSSTGLHPGLNNQDIAALVSYYNLRLESKEYFSSIDANNGYADHLYRYVESGFPCLLGFTTAIERHIVPVVGHTLNSDMWRPEAEPAYKRVGPVSYRPASQWVDHFIVHDDNFGMYFCLPIDALRRATLPSHDKPFRAFAGFTITPPEVKNPPQICEWASLSLLQHFLGALVPTMYGTHYWFRELTGAVLQGGVRPMVVRTLLVKKTDYLLHLELKDNEENVFGPAEIALQVDHLPASFWLTEVSIPDLYTANKTKLGDILFRSDRELPVIMPGTTQQDAAAQLDQWSSENWIQVRLPGQLVKRGDSTAHPMVVGSHYPVFRVHGEERPLEW